MAEDKPTAEVSVLASSKYVWRGFELSDDSIVLQPSATVAYKGFSANLWGNLDTDQDTSLYDVDGANFNALVGLAAPGKFGADMQVSLTNDGPVTFWLHVH